MLLFNFDTVETLLYVAHNYQIAKDDAVLMAETTARQDHRRIAGIGHVDRQARRNQHGLAGRQVERRVDAGAQVEPRAALRCIGRQQVLHARVENFDVDGFHVASSLGSAWNQPCIR